MLEEHWEHRPVPAFGLMALRACADGGAEGVEGLPDVVLVELLDHELPIGGGSVKGVKVEGHGISLLSYCT